MRLLGKLLLIFMFLSCVPLAIASAFMVWTFEERFEEQLEDVQSEQLRLLKDRLTWTLAESADAIRLTTKSFGVRSMAADEQRWVLRLLYSQVEQLAGVALVNPAGVQTTPAVYRPESGPAAAELALAFPDRTALKTGELEGVIALGRPADLEPGGQVWGDAIFLPQSELPLLPLWVDLGQGGFSVVALFTSAPILSLLTEFWHEHTRAIYLLEQNGRMLLGLDGGAEHTAFELGSGPLPQGLWEPVWTNSLPGKVIWGEGASEQLASYTDLKPLGLKLVSLTPYGRAMEPISELRKKLLYWLLASVVVAITFAVFFARTLADPIKLLSDAVREVGRGNYKQRVELKTRDEIGQLAYNFNRMARKLGHQRDEIERQQSEIQSWNEELQARVEARTQELKEAQDYLVHTGKLAAVAELGSGVAHELNNPLAVVLGFAQILRTKHSASGDPEGPMLERIEEQARRCKEIVFRLLSFSQSSQGQGTSDRFDLTEIFRGVFDLFEGYFAGRKVSIDFRLPAGLLIRGDRDKLKQAILQLVTAIRPTIPQGGALLLTGSTQGDRIEVCLEGTLGTLAELKIGGQLSSLSMTLERDQALSQGLGLWLAQKIIGEHDGLIRLEGTKGGTLLRLTLPIEAPRSGEDASKEEAAAAPAAPGGEV